MGLDASELYAEQAFFWVAVWAGDAAITAIQLSLQLRGVACEADDAFLKLAASELGKARDLFAEFVINDLPSLAELTAQTPTPPEQKFDAFVPDALRRESFGVRHLDRTEARDALIGMLNGSVAPVPKIEAPVLREDGEHAE